MDIYSTECLSQDLILELIHKTEEKYPSLKKENEDIIDWCGTQDGQEFLKEKMPDLNAAMISDCRSDILRCGRCNFLFSMERYKQERMK